MTLNSLGYVVKLYFKRDNRQEFHTGHTDMFREPQIEMPNKQSIVQILDSGTEARGSLLST